MSDMKTITMRDLNRRTAGIIDEVQEGQTFELRRNGKVVAFLTRTCPPETKEKDDGSWEAHFRWLRKQSKTEGRRILKGFEEERDRQRSRHEYLISLGKKK
jgi:antitoxin (DNA-binding transcriptional repressor) of toxin-antitoxin stability system